MDSTGSFIRDRGSALVITLVLVLVMTLLGFALFHLGVLEARLVVGSEADFKALEIAQAGIERALYNLYLDACATVDCAEPPANWSWADGSINGIGVVRTTSQFTPLVLPSNGLSTGLLGEVSGNGSYSVVIRNLSPTQAASQFSVGCEPDPVAPSTYCRDVMLVRSTGTYGVGTIEATRTIQLLARARSAGPGAEGITAGASSGQSINGNVRIAGSVHIVGCTTPPCAELEEDPLSLGGGGGIQNNYRGMPDGSNPSQFPIRRLIPQPSVVCPIGNPGCNLSTEGVESLGASVRVAAPVLAPAINLSGNAWIGDRSNLAASYTYSPCSTCANQTVRPKFSVDGVHVANGCQTADCRDNFGGTAGATHIVSDNGYTNPYNIDPTGQGFPSLTGYEVSIGGHTYDHYACAGVSGCPGSGVEFFGTHAFKASDATDELNDLFEAMRAGLTSSTDSVCATLSAACPSPVADPNTLKVSYVNPLDPAGSAANRTACIEWLKPPAGNQPGRLRFLHTVGGDCASTNPPLDSANPVLIYLDEVDGASGHSMDLQTDVVYEGSAIVVARGNVRIREGLKVPPCNPCPGYDTFPNNNTIAIATPGNMTVGTVGGGSDPALFGYFYAGGTWTAGRKIDVVGSVTATRFNLSQVPNFWQVRANDPNHVIFPSASKKYSVTTQAWRECRPPNPAAETLICDPP